MAGRAMTLEEVNRIDDELKRAFEAHAWQAHLSSRSSPMSPQSGSKALIRSTSSCPERRSGRP
jgi:hypothetical protein